MEHFPVPVLLAGTLALAVGWDLRTRRIPNVLTGTALLLGLLLHGFSHRALLSLEGVGVGGLSLLLYALRGGMGAGDVKLLLAVGALTGPVFTLWTLLGTALAGGLLGAVYLVVRGGRSGPATAALSARIPYAPAIALGAASAAAWLHVRVFP